MSKDHPPIINTKSKRRSYDNTRLPYSDNSEINRKIEFGYIDASRIHDSAKLLDFIEWNATPREINKIKTQGEFAKSIGVHADTLTDWKRLEGFWNEVGLKRNHVFRSFSTEIVNALAKRAMSGYAKEVELWLKLFEGHSDNHPNQNLPEQTGLSEERKSEIAKAATAWNRMRSL